MTWLDVYMHFLLALSFAPPIALLIMIIRDWYRDYKVRKYHKNRPRILNPWSDW